MIGKLYTASTHLCLYTGWNSSSGRMSFRGETMPSNELFMILGISRHTIEPMYVIHVLLASGETRWLLVYTKELEILEKQPTDV